MPNTFKLSGNYYVSKAGNDANAGTSPDAPKRTIQSALTAASSGQSIIVGAGQYNENLSRAAGSSTAIAIYADGDVVLKSSTNTKNTIVLDGQLSAAESVHWFNFTFVNYSISLLTATNGLSEALNPKIESCKLINCEIIISATAYPAAFNFFKSIFVNCIFNTTSNTQGAITLNKNIFVNSIVQYRSGQFTDNYLDSSSRLLVVNTAAAASYNNIQGSIVCQFTSSATSGIIQDVYNRYYDLSLAGTSGSGTLVDPFWRANTIGAPFNVDNQKVAYPTLNAVGSFSADPKFNSVEDMDFTLQANSPHLGKSSTGGNIGETNYGVIRTARIAFSGSDASVEPSLIFQYNNYVISGSEVTGSVVSAPMAVNHIIPKVIQKVTYNGLLAFNKDTGSATGSNTNVPDFDTFTSASLNAAANPDRLVYYMRHTTGSSIPVSDANWDNGGLWTAGEYNIFEWNTKPSIDASGVGNGSGSFNPASAQTYIQATYVQMKVKLRNDYLL